jgi:uncharacterized protein with HEPN domain
MRSDKLYLLDIIEAADAVQRFIEPIDEDSFLQDELRQSGVLQKLIVIGEAAARLSEDFRRKHKEIEWADIVGFRNIAVHQYFAVVLSIVWNTAIYDVPLLREKVAEILSDEFGGE